jgi:hypothetical protein
MLTQTCSAFEFDQLRRHVRRLIVSSSLFWVVDYVVSGVLRECGGLPTAKDTEGRGRAPTLNLQR